MATRRGQRQSIREQLPSDEVVLAIFAPDPYLVVTAARPLTLERSAWENPFMAGNPQTFAYFAA